MTTARLPWRRQRRRFALTAVTAVVMVAAVTVATARSTAPPIGAAAGAPPAAVATRRLLASLVRPDRTAEQSPRQTATHPAVAPAPVGALFASGSGNHYCSGSVVQSPHGDVVMTAAHCISGNGTNDVFVPGYDDGRAPYGRWRVVAAYAAPPWRSAQDPQDDVAFLVVAPQRIGGRMLQIQQVTGGYLLSTAPNTDARVTVVAYAAGKDDAPLRCAPWVYWHQGFPAFACAGYPGGTSGGPWLTVAPGRTDTVDGIIAGLHQGGCRTEVSYSPAFGATVRAVYQAAVDRAPAETLPAPGSDGC